MDQLILCLSLLGLHSVVKLHAMKTIELEGMGYISFTRSGRICRIYVEQEFRRRGIGSILVKLAEEQMLTESITGLALPSTRPFWKANGYSFGSAYDDRMLKKIKYQPTFRKILDLVIPFPFSCLREMIINLQAPILDIETPLYRSCFDHPYQDDEPCTKST